MELVKANRKIAQQNKERQEREAELAIANKELIYQTKEKADRAAELIVANVELSFQQDEKEKRAAELTVANADLVIQNNEKERRAAELIIANQELLYQNQEKEKRAAELIIANRELVYQNTEKEKRAAELTVANAELLFQNTEKENRARELLVANEELRFQHEEKEKRAAELVVANKELEFQNVERGKRAEELIAANKELESFSYSVSHDLRAPLRAVQGYARMLKEDSGAVLDAEGSRVVDNIVNGARKMGQLLDDLLTFSRLGRKELVKSVIPMKDMVTNLCGEIKNEQPDHNIDFKIHNILPAAGDGAVIKQAWINLISNAVKYSRLTKNAVIEIQSEERGQEIIYSITDNGAGFDMRFANKLFGVFQRLHNDDKFEGTGVGLAIVHRIISKHGGRVWGEGKVNEGATFRFTLPVNNEYDTGS